MRFDLHVHTDASHCGRMAVSDVLARARGLGLDGVCITDHDTTAALGRLDEGEQADGLVVLVGMEYSSTDGHVLLYGPDLDLPPGMAAARLLAEMRDRGGVAVPAHPFRAFQTLTRALWSHPLLRLVEGVNGRSTDAENHLAMRAAAQRGILAIGGSDAHTLTELGRVPTVLHAPIATRADLANALRGGRFTVEPSP
jgi:predicted metal-dependent phosphoesterase TrpH